MDFLGPITPNSLNGSVYIIIAVDYFSRYLFAHATKRNTGMAAVEFLNQICKFFGWPLALYVDNGAHFVKGELPKRCAAQGTKMFKAPITNPRSVGLAERYVQLILTGLRAVIEAHRIGNLGSDAMQRWDEYLDTVVQAINTRVLKVHGYTPSQLFLGFNIRTHPLDEVLEDSLRRIGSTGMGDNPRDIRLAQLEEIRELVRERVLQDQERQIAEAAIPRYEMPKIGDLVLRRRFIVDKSLGMKLETKWDGPYRLSRISKSGVSGDLQDLKTGRIIGRYAFEALKVFVPREDELGPEGWISLLEGVGGMGVNRDEGGGVLLG